MNQSGACALCGNAAHDASVITPLKVLKTDGDLVFVKWCGFDDADNCWVPRSDLSEFNALIANCEFWERREREQNEEEQRLQKEEEEFEMGLKQRQQQAMATELKKQQDAERHARNRSLLARNKNKRRIQEPADTAAKKQLVLPSTAHGVLISPSLRAKFNGRQTTPRACAKAALEAYAFECSDEERPAEHDTTVHPVSSSQSWQDLSDGYLTQDEYVLANSDSDSVIDSDSGSVALDFECSDEEDSNSDSGSDWECSDEGSESTEGSDEDYMPDLDGPAEPVERPGRHAHVDYRVALMQDLERLANSSDRAVELHTFKHAGKGLGATGLLFCKYMVYGFELVTSFDWATDSDGYYNFTLPDKDQEHGLREGVSFVLFAAINQAHWLKTSNIRGSYRLFFQTRTQISSRASVKLHTNTPETRLSLGDLANSFAKMAANYLCDDHEPLYIGEGIVHRAMCSLELPDKRGAYAPRKQRNSQQSSSHPRKKPGPQSEKISYPDVAELYKDGPSSSAWYAPQPFEDIRLTNPPGIRESFKVQLPLARTKEKDAEQRRQQQLVATIDKINLAHAQQHNTADAFCFIDSTRKIKATPTSTGVGGAETTAAQCGETTKGSQEDARYKGLHRAAVNIRAALANGHVGLWCNKSQVRADKYLHDNYIMAYEMLNGHQPLPTDPEQCMAQLTKMHDNLPGLSDISLNTIVENWLSPGHGSRQHGYVLRVHSHADVIRGPISSHDVIIEHLYRPPCKYGTSADTCTPISRHGARHVSPRRHNLPRAHHSPPPQIATRRAPICPVPE